LGNLGAYGTAVLYKKKDDDSLVILKEINLHELNVSERQLAQNEVLNNTICPLNVTILVGCLTGMWTLLHTSPSKVDPSVNIVFAQLCNLLEWCLFDCLL